jgi:hypothetical protein
MRKSCINSRIEVWSVNYINDLKRRNDKDRTVDIIQIEPSNVPNDYIVEVAPINSQENSNNENNIEKRGYVQL